MIVPAEVVADPHQMVESPQRQCQVLWVPCLLDVVVIGLWAAEEELVALLSKLAGKVHEVPMEAVRTVDLVALVMEEEEEGVLMGEEAEDNYMNQLGVEGRQEDQGDLVAHVMQEEEGGALLGVEAEDNYKNQLGVEGRPQDLGDLSGLLCMQVGLPPEIPDSGLLMASTHDNPQNWFSLQQWAQRFLQLIQTLMRLKMLTEKVMNLSSAMARSSVLALWRMHWMMWLNMKMSEDQKMKRVLHF